MLCLLQTLKCAACVRLYVYPGFFAISAAARNILPAISQFSSVICAGKTYVAIVNGTKLPEPGIPEASKVMIRELQGLGFDVGIYTADEKEVGLGEIDPVVDDTEMVADTDTDNKDEVETEIEFNQGAIEEPATEDLEMFDIDQLFEE